MRRSPFRGPVLGAFWACLALCCAQTAPPPPEPVAALTAPPAEEAPELASLPACGALAGVASSFRWPAQGAVTSAFGARGPRPHQGIDISGHYGRAVRAAAAGDVVFSGSKPGYGRVVILRHAGGIETVYAHNQDNFVRRGARVEQGQLIADMGASGTASGPHLHFEVRVGRRPIDPLGCLP